MREFHKAQLANVSQTHQSVAANRSCVLWIDTYPTGLVAALILKRWTLVISVPDGHFERGVRGPRREVHCSILKQLNSYFSYFLIDV